MKLSKNAVSTIIILVSLATVLGLSGVSYIIPQTPPKAPPDETAEGNQAQSQPLGMEKVSFKTQDNVAITANLYAVSNPKGWIIFSHMMPAVKESWGDLANVLAGAGFEGLAIDLRGHGESGGGPDGYKSFSDAETQKSIADLEVAAGYLVNQRGAAPTKISVIGASIGANLSLELMSVHPEVARAVLLSPGLDYHGVITEPMVQKLKAGQKVFFVSSKDDVRSGGNNAEQNQKLYDAIPEGIGKEIKIYDTAGHGTAILEKQPELQQLIMDFLNRI